MTGTQTPALVLATGASTSIGFELAKLLAGERYDLVIAADMPLGNAITAVKAAGAALPCRSRVTRSPKRASTAGGADSRAWPLDGVGKAFLHDDLARATNVVETDVLGGRLIWPFLVATCAIGARAAS